MRRPLRLLAIDLGAESGRAVVGSFDGTHLKLEEAHRFPNQPVRLGGSLYWDLLRLYGDVLTGLRIAQAQGELASMGVDAWGVDFGLLDQRGRLLGNPVHYRDARTRGMLERALQRVPRAEIYAATGIQLMPINTLYQLLALAEADDPDLQRAERLLLIPDLIHHFLSGSQVCEYTNATTTQCFDTRRGAWAVGLLERLGLPARLLPEVVQPGTFLGRLRSDVAAEIGGAGHLSVIAPASHDTASAVAATPLPAHGRTAFLSSGTWSLLGLEMPQPVVSDVARDENLTNEGGVAGTIRLLKNVMGLWLVQQARLGLPGVSYAELTALAMAAPSAMAFVDPDDERFLRPGDVRAAVEAFCAETSQPAPRDPGSLVRVLLESLALQYASVLRQLEAASGRTIDTIHVVGGGSNNTLLCQLTADACGLPVLSGPAEATAIGNLLVQGMTAGELTSLEQARELVTASFPTRRYEPMGDWTAQRQRFQRILYTRTKQGVHP